MNGNKPKLLVQFRRAMVAMAYAESTVKDYAKAVEKYIRFHDMRHPASMGEVEVGDFVTYLGYVEHLSPESQNKALCAIVLFYNKILFKPLGNISNLRWARKKKRLPICYSMEDMRKILENLQSPYYLIASLGFGCGLRIGEVLKLRLMDLDFQRGAIRVVQGKHSKDRDVPLPNKLIKPLKRLSEFRAQEFIIDKKGLSVSDANLGEAASFVVEVPKYPEEQFLFVHRKPSVDYSRRVFYRKIYTRQSVDKALKRAIRIAGIPCVGGFHSLRHSYSTAAIGMGMNIRELQHYLGHNDINTTQIYTHVLNNEDQSISSPLSEIGNFKD